MERYPVLGWIVRFGTAGTVALAVLVAALIVSLGWASFGALSLVLAALAAAVIFIVGKSYVEIVTILTEMLVPR